MHDSLSRGKRELLGTGGPLKEMKTCFRKILSSKTKKKKKGYMGGEVGNLTEVASWPGRGWGTLEPSCWF